MNGISQPRCPNCGAAGRAAHADLRDKVYGAPGEWNMQRCGAATCGVLWLDPMPKPTDLVAAYRDYHTHVMARGASGRASLSARASEAFVARTLGLPTQASWLPRLIGQFWPLFANRAQSALYEHFYLSPLRGARLLEVGCGSGEQLAVLARDGWNAQGIDFDPQAAAVARSRGLEVAVGDLRELSFQSASFDAIVMAQLIEHVYDPPGLLRECARLLRPGGRMVAMTPNADALGHRVFGRDWRGLEPPRHLVIYTARGLRLACANAGLQVERLDATARDAANLFLASERIRRNDGASPIERPVAGQRPPLRLRLLAAFEQIGRLCGLGWGEELVVMARKPGLP